MNSSKKRRRRSSAAALAGLVFVAAAAMSLSILVLHGTHRFPAHHDLNYPPTFVSKSKNATQKDLRVPTQNETALIEKPKTQNTTTADSCFSLNSISWLEGPRLGNAPLETDEAAMDLILNMNIPFILEQTLCHEKSRFRDWKNDISSDDEASLNLAALRIVYLAFHVHQHEPAWKEARHRQQYCTANDMQQYNIGDLDYECPEAKFLVVPLGEAGLGAIMRLTVVNALLAGMATKRVVMFVNNATVGPQNVQKPWPHASCPRHDLQCFFLAPTPCVLSEKELANAHVLERSEMRQMFRTGEISSNNKVVVTKINTRPHMAPAHLREHLVAIAKQHITNHELLLERAADLIYEIEPLEESQYYYFGHRSKVHHGAVFYAMRPRPEYATLLNEIMNDSLPENFDSKVSLGLPIRASDKCEVESECLTFDQHMKVMKSIWNKHHHATDNAVANIVVTTEDERVMGDMRSFNKSLAFPYRFITNKQDVLQGTGVANDFEKTDNITADQVMLSSVAALKLQLSAKYTVGNCCSNFHNLLFDFMRDGCGAARDVVVTCLQEMDKREFRVCCAWDKSDECVARRHAAVNNGTLAAKP